MHCCYHSLSYARIVGGNLCLVQCWAYAQAKHTLNSMLVPTHTHTELSRSCPEDLLITLSKREAVRHKEGQPPGLSHTPPRLPVLLMNILFLAFIYDFFLLGGQRCMGGIVRGSWSVTSEPKYKLPFKHSLPLPQRKSSCLKKKKNSA